MDRDLVLRVQAGDEDAFEALVTNDHARLFRVAQGILRDRQLAEDATQQAFIEVWRHIADLKEIDRFDGWSYRLLVRICYAESRRRPRWLPEQSVTPADEPFVGDVTGVVIDRDQLARGFERLSVEHRAVLVLRYLLDLPTNDIADALGVAPGTASSRINRALESLRAILEADERDPEPRTLTTVTSR